MNSARLTIVIPTIAERAQWLADCLDSILPIPEGSQAEVVVSGNGTGEATRQVCRLRSVRLVEHGVRMTASQHGRALLEMDLGHWIWFVPDDDLLSSDGVTTVLRYLREYSPDVIVGRTRRFVRPDLSDLSVPVPSIRPFLVTSDIRAMAEATRMRIDLGAFVCRSGLLSTESYDRYSGTSHEAFGALWDGLISLSAPRVVITPEVLVYARQANKAHDDTAWRTWIGMLRVAELLPRGIRDIASAVSGEVVSFRPVIRAVAEGERPSRYDIPNSVWECTSRVQRGAFRLATHCPPALARLALFARRRLPFLSRARGAPVASQDAQDKVLRSNDGA